MLPHDFSPEKLDAPARFFFPKNWMLPHDFSSRKIDSIE